MDDREPTPLYITVTIDYKRENAKLFQGLLEYDEMYPHRIFVRLNADGSKMRVRLPWMWAKELYKKM